jgi:hypothetical protein
MFTKDTSLQWFAGRMMLLNLALKFLLPRAKTEFVEGFDSILSVPRAPAFPI